MTTMNSPMAHLFVQDDFDGLPMMVLRLEGDDKMMVEVSAHDWRVALQWAVVMQYGAALLAERSGAEPSDVRDMYNETIGHLTADS